MPHIAIAIFIAVMILQVPAVAKGFYNLPEISSTGSNINQFNENYFISVPVGVAEDFVYLFLLPRILLSVVLGFITMKFGELNKWQYASLAVVICIVASAGYGALMPGFASTHEVAFRDDSAKYTYVFAMGVVQSTTNMFTGTFLPLGHTTNNWLVNNNYQGKVVGGVQPIGG